MSVVKNSDQILIICSLIHHKRIHWRQNGPEFVKIFHVYFLIIMIKATCHSVLSCKIYSAVLNQWVFCSETIFSMLMECYIDLPCLFQPPKKQDPKGGKSSQKKPTSSGGGKAKKKVEIQYNIYYLFSNLQLDFSI